jgi:hypothetical protein
MASLPKDIALARFWNRPIDDHKLDGHLELFREFFDSLAVAVIESLGKAGGFECEPLKATNELSDKT